MDAMEFLIGFAFVILCAGLSNAAHIVALAKADAIRAGKDKERDNGQ